MELTVNELPPRRLLGLCQYRPYGQVGRSFMELASIGGRRGLIGPDTEFVGLLYDNPATTHEKALRYDACMTSNVTDVDAPLHVIEHSGGKHVVYRHTGSYALLQIAFFFGLRKDFIFRRIYAARGSTRRNLLQRFATHAGGSANH